MSKCPCSFNTNNLVFTGDETYVPKNTTVVVKRMPVPSGQGLLSRLQNSHGRSGGGHSSAPRNDQAIVIPPKVVPKPEPVELAKPTELVQQIAPASSEMKASSEISAEEEALALQKLSQKLAPR